MEILDLTALAEQHLSAAKAASNGRSSTKLVGDHTAALRANLIALAAGASLQEHESPGDATLTVVQGAVDLSTNTSTVTIAAGQMAPIPPERHGVTARTDAVFVLTVAKR